MFAVITKPELWVGIEKAVVSKGEEILYKAVDTEINIKDELEKISRISVRHLVIDIASLEDEKQLVSAIRQYRIKRESTQVIIIAPNYMPGNETLSLLVTMGIYDIIAPSNEVGEDSNIVPLLLEVLDKPSSYARAVKWDIGAMQLDNTNTKTETKEVANEKVKVKVEYRDVVESVFKKVIAVYSPTSEGTSRVAAHLAHSIATNKECKVALLDFQVFNPVQREIFEINPEYTLKDTLDAVVKNTLSPVVLESYTKQSKRSKNLDVLSGLYDFNEYYNTQENHFEEIIEKAKFNYDYVVIDTHSFFDLYPTNRALLMADEIIVPVRGRKNSIDTLNRFLDNFAEYNDFDIRKFKLVINQYSGDDLTSIEIAAKTEYPIAGYISYHKDYDRSNAFKNNKLMGEYIEILKEIGIKTSKRRKWFSGFGGFKAEKGDE